MKLQKTNILFSEMVEGLGQPSQPTNKVVGSLNSVLINIDDAN